MGLLRNILAIALMVTCLAGPTVAQNQFQPVIRVGDDVITRYQLNQRTRFLSLLRAPGDPRSTAREQLINESVQLQAARSVGLVASDAEISAGLEEFAGRANLTAEQFLTALGQNGVDGATYRDFITAGVTWRNYVRTQLSEGVRETIPESQVRRTLSRSGTEGGLRVLISEIILPAGSPKTAAASNERARRLAQLDGEDAFANAARTFSIAPTSRSGGELAWRAIDTLPDDVANAVRGLSPGQISRPIDLGTSIGLFLMRQTEQVAPGTPDSLSIDYALFVTSGGREEAAAVARRIDTCDDLYAVAKGLPEERLIRETSSASDLPADVRAEVARLDDNETSTALTRGGNATVLMLCERTAEQESTVDFEIVGTRLLNQRLSALAAHELARQRARFKVIDLQ